MSIIDRLLKDLFPEKTVSHPPIREVLVREMIKRNQIFWEGYKDWKDKQMHLGLIDHLNESSLIRLSNPEADVNFYHYKSSHSSGFYFRGEDPWSSKDYSYFTQHLIEVLELEDYYLNNSTREVVEEDNQLKTVETFYLKPSLKFRRELPYNQLYGNVLIEHRMLDGETNLLKFMANTYTDSNFQDALDFEILMDKIWLF